MPFNVIGQVQTGSENEFFPAGSFEYGDAAKWNGDKIYLYGNSDPFFSYVSFFEKEPGRFVRHPYPALTYYGFGADIRCMSRDQLSGVLAGIIAEDDTAAAWRLIRAHAKRGFLFAWNSIHNGVEPQFAKWKLPDLTGPTVWAGLIRATQCKWLVPLLWVFDLMIWIDAYWQRYLDGEDNNECISFLMMLFIANDHSPTFFSRKALAVTGLEDMDQELKSYWNGWRKHPEMVPLYMTKLRQLKARL